jgi:hypothetical protein
VTVDELVEELFPVIDDLLARIEGEEFTTVDFIDVMLADPAASAAYQRALTRWGEQERQSRMVVHGQVIPAALRQSHRVRWVGFAHGVQDEYAVPAWWRLLDEE